MDEIAGDDTVMASNHIDGLTSIALLDVATGNIKVVNTGHLQTVVVAAAADIAEGEIAQHHVVGGGAVVAAVIDIDAMLAGILEGQPLDHEIAGVADLNSASRAAGVDNDITVRDDGNGVCIGALNVCHTANSTVDTGLHPDTAAGRGMRERLPNGGKWRGHAAVSTAVVSSGRRRDVYLLQVGCTGVERLRESLGGL